MTEAGLADTVHGGESRAIARAISLVENGDPAARELVRELYPATGTAHIVGITGAPGAGKSSLVSALIGLVRGEGRSVGVISVDPSSPFTQGALLGDRIRLADHFVDPGVFIRSMGTRGHSGGLAEATLQAVLVLDAAGKDVIFVETVGTGQNEIGVTSVADTVLLVLMPGAGDSVQALKAGIMEIPDVIAVNKSDLPGANETVRDVTQMLALAPAGAKLPPVLATDSLQGAGVPELWAAIVSSYDGRRESGALATDRRERLARDVLAVAAARAAEHLQSAVERDPELLRLVERVQDRSLDPLTAMHELLEKVFKIGDDHSTDTR